MAGTSVSVQGMVHASIFGAATAVGALIIIPLPPVPVTLQTMVLAIGAALLGARLGALSQAVYLLLGIMGLPVFAGGKAGVATLLGPTGGYLIGFVAGAYVIGRLMEMGGGRPGFVRTALCMAAGSLVIYLLGVTYLSLIAKLSIRKAVAAGVLPFLIGDTFKILVATSVVLRLREMGIFRSVRH